MVTLDFQIHGSWCMEKTYLDRAVEQYNWLNVVYAVAPFNYMVI